MHAGWLITRGYRKVSNKYRIVARIDREDWIEVLYKKVFSGQRPGIIEAVKSYYRGEKSLKSFGFMSETVEHEAKMAADYYRRCYSEDMIEGLDSEIFSEIPGSSGDIVGYKPKRSGEEVSLREVRIIRLQDWGK